MESTTQDLGSPFGSGEGMHGNGSNVTAVDKVPFLDVSAGFTTCVSLLCSVTSTHALYILGASRIVLITERNKNGVPWEGWARAGGSRSHTGGPSGRWG